MERAYHRHLWPLISAAAHFRWSRSTLGSVQAFSFAGVNYPASGQNAPAVHSGENPDLAFLRLGKESFRRALAEDVEDDLHRLNVRELDG